MKYLMLFFVFQCLSFGYLIAQDTEYPITKKIDHTDDYFGKKINDPYVWLENREDTAVITWINAQKKFSDNYLKNLPNRFGIELKLKKNTWYYYRNPRKQGKYFVVSHTDNELKSFDFFYSEEVNGHWTELNVTKGLKLKKDEDLYLSNYKISNDSKYLAFAFNRNGSDWNEVKVVEIKSGKILEDHLYNLKATSIAWKGDGFYYARYDSVNDMSRYSEQSRFQRLYYHQLGTSQEKDSLIFKRNDAPFNVFFAEVSEDERFLIVTDFDQANSLHNYYYYDFNAVGPNGLKPLAKKVKYYLNLIGHYSDTLIFKNGKNKTSPIIGMDIKNPKKWVEMIPKIEDAIFKDAEYFNGNFYVIASHYAEEKLIIFDVKGNVNKIITFPFGTHYSIRGEDYDKHKLYFSYESMLHPPALISIDMKTFQFDLEEQVKVNYQHQDYEIKKIWYKSDTVNVPMLLMYKKGIILNNDNPLLLEFYGGFNHSFEASFDPGKIMFIENGGVYAFAMIRGGGELGIEWHNSGRVLNKNNSLNDIINAAKFLVEKKYTSYNKLAISGGSQGGLMAAAAAIKAPELFKVSIPIVGPHDMLRYEKYTYGPMFVSEYGSVSDSIEFKSLLSYSPIHNVKNSVKYPAMLIMTSEFDDRVPPFHSFKLAATLQDCKSPNAILRVQKGAGHHGAGTYQKSINELVDFYSFLFQNLGITKIKP